MPLVLPLEFLKVKLVRNGSRSIPILKLLTLRLSKVPCYNYLKDRSEPVNNGVSFVSSTVLLQDARGMLFRSEHNQHATHLPP